MRSSSSVARLDVFTRRIGQLLEDVQAVVPDWLLAHVHLGYTAQSTLTCCLHRNVNPAVLLFSLSNVKGIVRNSFFFVFIKIVAAVE